ncbi:hypothetical protein BGZ58_004541 [Dissophora ornata]|nr:hypothetical protein BGZ58_004541 [Dissophora ornata]
MSMIPASAIILVLSLCTQIISANLNCTSPILMPDGLQPGNAIELGFTMDDTGLFGLDIAADLICSSTGKTALSLGKGFDETDAAPNSPMVNVTATDATDAIKSCPSNSFHVRYTASSVITSEVANCTGNFSIQAADLGVQVASSLSPSASPSSAAPSKTKTKTASSTTTKAAAHTSTISAATASPTQDSLNATTTTPTTTTATTAISPTSTVTQQAATPSPSADGSGDSSNDIPAPSPTASPTAQQSSSPSSADLQSNSNSGSSNSTSGSGSSSSSSSPSIKTVAIASGSVVGGIAVILSMMLLWRKHHQRRQSLDQMYSDSLVASSGFDSSSSFSPKPIFARDGTGLGIATVSSPPQTHTIGYYKV